MAVSNDGSIILKTKVDTSGVQKGMGSIQSIVTKVGGLLAAAFSVRVLTNFAKESINLASDLQEVQNVVDTAFGSMAYKIENFTKTSIEQFGLGELAAKQWSSTMMAMGTGMGQAMEVGSDMAVELTGRLADVMSFYNKTEEEAFTLGKAIYSGETEPLKNIGIIMTENNLALFAMSKGYKTAYKDMDAANKLLVRQQYFLEKTSLAAGDYAKTQDGWANSTRTLQQRWKEMQTVWGQAFMSIGVLVLPVINNIINGLTRAGQVAQVAAQWIYKAFTGKNLEVSAASKQSEAIGGAVENQEQLNEAITDTQKAQKGVLAGFDDIQTLTSQKGKNLGDLSATGGLDVDASNIENEETGEGYDFSALKELGEYLEGLSVLAASIGTSLLAWKITDLIVNDSARLLSIFKTMGGVLSIVAGAILLAQGYSDAWVNGIEWNNLSIVFSGLALSVGGIAIVISPVIAAFVGLGAAIAIVILGFRDIVENGVSVQNVLTIISGMIVGIVSGLAIFGKVSVFASLLPLLATLAGAFLAVRGAVDALANGVDWGNLSALLGGVALAITAIALSSDLLYTGIALIVGGIALFVIGLSDMINNGANAKNMILTLAGAIATAIGIVITMSQALGASLSPAVYIAVAGFTALSVGIGSVISQWDNMSNAEKVISVLGLLAVAASSAAIAFGSLQSAWSLGVAAAGIIAGIVAITAAVNSASKQATGDIANFHGVDLSSYATDFTSKIPKLAKGAVLPANKPFLALVGDQKTGTNVETPLSTIEEAVANVMGRQGGGSNTIIMQIDGREFGRAVIDQGDRENRRIGTRLVTT